MKMNPTFPVLCFAVSLALTLQIPAKDCSAQAPQKDIRKLSQHFIKGAPDTSPWKFGPQENIASLSLTEHPGVVTIWEAGKGKDIKGLLDDPIRIDDYPLPWDYHLGIVQNYQAMKGISEQQINYAIGLNLAVTFSDPSTWPKDRNVLPPDTHTLQLLVVHLGSVGEIYRQGVPQVKASRLNNFDPSPEVYLLYCRGDLAPEANGDWKMAYTWVGFEGSISGSWSKGEGPANSIIRFRAGLLNPTTMHIGMGYGDHPGWRMRNIDVSRFGKITGIWEIGPIISLDRWIPDTLAKELGIAGEPEWFKSFKQRLPFLGKQSEADSGAVKEIERSFRIDPPDPKFAYYIDYSVFNGNGPKNFDHFSDEFEIAGFLADQKWYVEGNGVAETYSNPGYLTVTLLGMNGAWAMCPILSGDGIDLKTHRPPLEVETSFICPDDSIPWNLWWTFGLSDEEGKNFGQSWVPGVQNIPGKGRSFINMFNMDPEKFATSSLFNLEFEPALTQTLLTAKPLQMLVQVPDAGHIKVGFRAKNEDPWQFSQTMDVEKAIGKRIGKIGYPCLASIQGVSGAKGWGVGNSPGYQKILIDYIRFRSADTPRP